MTDPHAAPRRQFAGGPDGVVLLDKPVGMTSNMALQQLRRLFGARKAGHTGSLDPLASGLLPICLGQATRFSGYLLDAPKSYRVSARLGQRTATGDAQGEVVETCAWDHLDKERLDAVLGGFRGASLQVPPMYSALKQGGERLYRKARRGEVVERAPREIRIERLELEHWDPPGFSLDVRCSKGTYVRTLVEDVARIAGSCAHVTALRRYAAGPYAGDDMHTLEELEALATDAARLAETVLPVDSALAELPAVALGAEDALQLMHGKVLELPACGPSGLGLVRVYAADGFLGIGERRMDGQLKARRLLGTAEALAKA
jgi:tRNA pseudouridine55 synthase